MAATYRDAGVDLDIYAESMGRLPALMHRTFSPRVLRNDGGFAGLFQLDFAGKLFARNYKQPILVSGTDGVGTKLKVAQQTGRHSTVGIDLVAMCVNDLLCTGAEPLFFLDYVAMGKDDPDRLEQIVKGISDGCVAADCSLLGGETAIMPDMYAIEDYDLAGFAVGVVDRDRLIDGKAITLGDRVIGLASSGLHSNGFSLVRKIIRDSGIDFNSHNDELGGNVADELLKPTNIYVEAVRAIQSHYRVKQVIHGIAHITGGGIEENLDRILPKTMDAKVSQGSWPVPSVFGWLQKLGEVEPSEMRRVFNMGIGLTIVVSPYYATSVMTQLQSLGIACYDIGEIVAGTGKVQIV
jgi:phosphoribosylformylglycinamidine cyclo-ligase